MNIVFKYKKFALFVFGQHSWGFLTHTFAAQTFSHA